MPTNGNYTHEFHPYPAKFPPEVSRTLILELSKPGNVVLDPFCGSGTTLVEARLENRSAIGIELNPIGALISRAKSIYYSGGDLESLEKFLGAYSVEKLSRLEHCSDYSAVSFPNRSHWFSDTATKELATLRHLILSHPLSSTNVGLLLKMAFSRIVVPISNQDTETRYARVNKQHPVGAAYALFLKTCSYYLGQLVKSERKPSLKNQTEVYEGDIKIQFANIADESVDFILTSPAYINSFDYYLYHKQRMHWLNYDPRKIRALEIGNHHRIDTKNYDDAVLEYRNSMALFMQESRRTLRKRGHVAVLIGDGIVKDRVMAADQLMEEIADGVGLSLSSKKTWDLAKVSKTFIKEHDRISRKKHHVLIFMK